MLHLEKLFYSVPQRMSVCGFCLSYTLPWDLGLFCCIPTFVFLNIVCGGNFHLSRQQMWMRTKFSNRCRIRRWPNRLPFYSSNNSGHWASVGYTWYGFTNIIRHQLFVRQYQCTFFLTNKDILFRPFYRVMSRHQRHFYVMTTRSVMEQLGPF